MLSQPVVGLRFLTSCMVVVAAAAHASAEHRSGESSAQLFRHTTVQGDGYFALSLEAGELPVALPATRDHILLIDTSASQVGAHRKQAFGVAESYLKSLPDSDRFRVIAVDVRADHMGDGFQSAQADSVETTMAALNKRIPAGASNLHAGLTSALESADRMRSTCIAYIGDGMSTADLIEEERLEELLTSLRNDRIVVNSYAVGPATDLRLLGIIAQYTGGVVDRDGADEEKDDPALAGAALAVAAASPVFYPDRIAVDSDSIELLPRVALPLRADRSTIYFGHGNAGEPFAVTTSGTVDGREQSLTWQVSADQAHDDGAFLRAMWTRASADEGLSVPLAGLDMLEAARRSFEMQVAQMVNVGYRAVANRKIDDAEQIADAADRLDPDNQRVRELVASVDEAKAKGKVRTIAQVDPNAAEAGPADATLPPTDPPADAGTEATPPEPTPPGENSLLDRPEVQALQDEAPGGAESLIERERRLRAIRAEQLTLEVARLLEQVRAIADREPDVALGELKSARGTIEAQTDIDPEIREQLLRRLTSAILDLTAQVEVAEQRRVEAQEKLALVRAQEALQEQLLLNQERLEAMIDQVRAHIEDGYQGDPVGFERGEAVARAALDLEPGNGPATAALFTAEAAGQLDKAYRLRALRADRFLETLYQVELSHVPFPDEPPIRFPPAEVWQRLTERRKEWTVVDLRKPNPNEELILRTLEDQTELNLVGQPFAEAIDFLSQLHQIPIRIDEPALAEVGILTDTPIEDLVVSNITLRSALNLVFEQVSDELTWIIEDEVMKITTKLDAETNPPVRVYPVRDIFPPAEVGGGGGGFGGGQGGGGFGGGQGGGFGGGGGGIGGGAFSVPAENLRLNQRRDDQPAGQAMFQVQDSPADGFRFDNRAVEQLKKKRAASR